MFKTLQRPLAAAALCALGSLSATPAQALSFDFNVAPGTTTEQAAAFQEAADYWSNKLSDAVTVKLDIGFAALGAGILGQAGSTYTTASYVDVRNALLADASSAVDAMATASLQAGPTLSFLSSNMDGSTRLNNDTSSASCASLGPCDTDNRRLALTTANARALGLSGGAASDGSIMFNTAFAADFQFSRAGGIAAGKTDFITVALHEIGHVLGFVSGVDDADYCQANAGDCFGTSTPSNFALEDAAIYSPLDLFRYSANGVLDLRTGGNPYFSIDGGASAVTSFSTGEATGNGDQASHFGTGLVTLMRPFVAPGESYNAFGEDLTAMDAIGWNLVLAVPEPGSWALMLAGAGLVGLRLRRQA